MLKAILVAIFITISVADNITIYLNWKYQFEFAGFIMAKEKGFFKEEGLNVTLKEFSKKNILKLVESKEGVYGVDGNSLILNILKGAKIKLLMPIYIHSPFELVVVGKKVKSLKDIEKYHLPMDKFSAKSNIIALMFKSENIDISKLKKKIVPPFNPKKIKNGIYSIFDTNEIYYLDKNHIKYSVFRPIDYGFDGYADVLYTSSKEFKQHPKRVKEVMKAIKKGYIYAFNHINESVNIIYNKYNTLHKSKEALFYEANKLKDNYFDESFKFDKSKIDNLENVYLLLGLAKKKIDLDEFIYNKYNFTPKELKFINDNIVNCITTSTWEPFNLMQNGEISGIAIDYWKYIKKEAGIKTLCKIDNNWIDVLKHIKNKTADITLSTTKTPDREKYAIFSKPYASFPIVIATRNNVGFISNLNLIKDKTIAVGKGYTAEKLLQKNYPYIKLIEVKNIDEALKLVSEGKVFAAVDILPVIAYKINKYHYVNLKISGKTPFNFKVRMMVRNDYPLLVSIINKVIANMPKEKKEQIYNKWISVTMQNGYSNSYINKIYFYILIGIVVVSLWIFFLVREIFKRKKIEKKLEELATIDGLTAIFNRYKIDVSLEKQMEIARRYHRKMSIIFFDIDYFKKVNDTYGHEVGDLVLIEISKLVTQNIRQSDIFGRWGGEEFLIILPETSLESAKKLAEKLRKIIENHTFEKVGKITCSFGVTEFKEDDTYETIISRVDELLYKSKTSGRNRVSS